MVVVNQCSIQPDEKLVFGEDYITVLDYLKAISEQGAKGFFQYWK
jgi:hypothetical protein